MNFRLAPEITDHNYVVKKVNDQAYAELLAKDEFLQYRVKDELLKTFAEGAINFAPTYKYMCGTNNYDKGRVPAWSDRVLWSTRTLD